jgi:hypothetical protein
MIEGDDGYLIIDRPSFAWKVSGIASSAEFIACTSTLYGDSPSCPLCGRAIGHRLWSPPRCVEVNLYKGLDMEDLILGSGGPDFVITENFLSIWTSLGFTGLDGVHAVDKVLGKIRINSKRLFGVDLPSNGTRIDSALSKAVRNYRWDCELCDGYDLDAINGVVFEPESMSDVDIFKCINANIVGIRANVRELLLKEGLNLSNFVPATEYCWSFQ